MQTLKGKLPKVLITVQHTAYVTSCLPSDSSTSDDQEVAAQWAEEDHDNSDCSNIAYIATDDLKEIERSLAMSTFLHGMFVGIKRC